MEVPISQHSLSLRAKKTENCKDKINANHHFQNIIPANLELRHLEDQNLVNLIRKRKTYFSYASIAIRYQKTNT